MEAAWDRFELKTKIQFFFKFYFFEFPVLDSKPSHVAPFTATVLFNVKFF